MESISSRVLIWTLVEAMVLVGVAYWQVGVAFIMHACMHSINRVGLND